MNTMDKELEKRPLMTRLSYLNNGAPTQIGAVIVHKIDSGISKPTADDAWVCLVCGKEFQDSEVIELEA